jgi:glucose/arabinose dehydrogenase
MKYIGLFSFALLCACSGNPIVPEDVSNDRLSSDSSDIVTPVDRPDPVRDVLTEDSDMDATSVADADSGQVSEAGPMDDVPTLSQMCIMRRGPVGSGVGPGADRCMGVTPPTQGMGATWCSLGQAIPGLVEPAGFCVRRFATGAIMPRTMAIAPNGDLFVSSPSQGTGAGDTGGRGEIIVMSDDDRDGTAEQRTFLSGLASVHAIAFSGDRNWLYFTTSDGVHRTPYRPGLRAEMAAMREVVSGAGDATTPAIARGRWTHGLAVSVNNRVLLTNGEYSSCMFTPTGGIVPGAGAIYEVGSHALTRVAAGFRNPMYARCHFCRDLCIAAELGEDNRSGAIEKLVIVDRERWHGYPCCDQNNPDPMLNMGACACVDREQTAIRLGDTPFGLDWEKGAWPEPYRNSLFVALHGTFYQGATYAGAGVVFLRTDPATGRPTAGPPIRFLEATNLNAPNMISLSRPSDVVFSNDGRLFIGDDHGHAVYWMAPTNFRMP